MLFLSKNGVILIRFLLLTGMSGAGKTVALRHLEDMGALCVDNLPPMMLIPFIKACQNGKHAITAISVDIRAGDFFDADTVAKLIDEASEAGYSIQLLFVDACSDVLINRYKETRREHPLCAGELTLEEAICKERNKLTKLLERANHTIDTSSLKPRELQQILRTVVLEEEQIPGLKIEVLTFGFKRGLPRDADLLFDVRFLPNPFYIPELCRHTGQDADVSDFVMNHPVTKTFMNKLMDLLAFLLPHYEAEGKRRLVIAIGCTGGCHRSVAIAESAASSLRKQGYHTNIVHRDMLVEQVRVTECINV